MHQVDIKLLRLEEGADLPLPAYMTPGSAGCDLYAAVGPEPVVIAPGCRMLISAGFAIALPSGYEAQIRPRSGLALKHGVTVLNTPGTIDADYRGPVGVCLINLGQEPFIVHHGDRIAQMVVAPYIQGAFQVCDDLDETGCGKNGFGSTGAN